MAYSFTSYRYPSPLRDSEQDFTQASLDREWAAELNLSEIVLGNHVDQLYRPQSPLFDLQHLHDEPLKTIHPLMLSHDVGTGYHHETTADSPRLPPVTGSPFTLSPFSSGSLSAFSSPELDTAWLPPPKAPRRSADADSDYQDNASERDDDDDSDFDEYDPSHRVSGAKSSKRRARRASASKPYRRKASPPAGSSSSSSSHQHPRSASAPVNTKPSKASGSSSRAAARSRMSSASRLPLASGEMAERLERAVKCPQADGCKYVCPMCGRRQPNSRMPDFKRHLQAHLRAPSDDESRGWWCKGMLVETFRTDLPLSQQHEVLSSCPNRGEEYIFDGQRRIGGCRLSFSRRDALVRHLNNARNDCIGTAER